MSADDTAARIGRQHVHMTQDVCLGEPREDADMIKRGAEAAAGEREPDFAEPRGSGHLDAGQRDAPGLAGRLLTNDIDRRRRGVPPTT